RAGSERAPAAKCACVRLLDQVFGLLFRPDEMSSDAIHLIGKGERLLLEPHAVTCLLREASGGLRARLAHRDHPTKRRTGVLNAPKPVHIPVWSPQIGAGRRSMKGYTVITSDEKKAGHVVDEQGDYLIVEHGTIFKSRRPLPRAFAHADESEEIVRTTVPYAIIDDAPEIGDDEAIARHYGLVGPDPHCLALVDVRPVWADGVCCRRD